MQEPETAPLSRQTRIRLGRLRAAIERGAYADDLGPAAPRPQLGRWLPIAAIGLTAAIVLLSSRQRPRHR